MKDGVNLNEPFTLKRLAWPIFIETFLFTLLGFVDVMMLSQVSDEAVAGVGAANQYIQLAIIVVGVVSIGAGILVARAMGGERVGEAGQYTVIALILHAVVGFLLSIFLWVAGERLLRLLGVEGQALVLGALYLKVVGAGFIFQSFLQIFSTLLRTAGATKQMMNISFQMNIINLLLNGLLIFGWFGMPALGVLGAAIGTVVSRLLGVIFAVRLFWSHYQEAIKRRQEASRAGKLRAIVSLGWPGALEKVLYRGLQIGLLSVVAMLGMKELAIRNYVFTFTSFVYLFAIALSSATSILVARAYGQRDWQMMQRTTAKSVKWSFYLTISSVLVISLASPLIMPYVTEDSEIVRRVFQLLVLSIVVDSAGSMNMVIVHSLRAMGDAQFPAFIGIVSMFLIGLPLAYFLTLHTSVGLVGVWIGLAVDEWLRYIILKRRWRQQFVTIQSV